MAHKFRKNDEVLVISGSNKGKKGKIRSIFKKEKVIIDGVNVVTIHKKASSSTSGEIKKIEKPIHISNISHIDVNRPAKIGFRIESGDGKGFFRKSRILKKTGKKID